ncbi:MAG: nitroreductase family protein [Promethearchaeota archaeon]
MNKDTIMKIIKERRSVRVYKQDMIPAKIIEKVIESAIWAPSSCNRQPWHFIIVKNDKLKKVLSFSVGGQKTLLSAPVVIVICINTSLYWNLKGNIAPFIDAGVAMQNILLTTHSLGIGACPIAGHIEEDIVKDALNIPDEYKIMAYIACGYPNQIPPPPERQEVHKYYSIDSFRKIKKEGLFTDICLKRKKISRLGGDVSKYYENPAEKIPIFEYAMREISKIIENKNNILFTYSGMGYFLKSAPKNAQCLVSSMDEKWFIEDFKGLKTPSILIHSLEDLSSMPTKYDCIVSLFDLHFMDEIETEKFFEGINRILHKDGDFILVFLNKKSFYGLNYFLASSLNIDLDKIRPCGYERPLDIDVMVKKVSKKNFKIISIKTGLFIPPINFAYLFKFIPCIPYKMCKWLDLLQKIPFIRRKGNVVFVRLEKSSSF